MAKFSEVLLVEDDPITILVCDRMIKLTSFAEKVITCENGKIALDFLATLESQQLPPIIFLDINMPVMNGWDFLDEFEILKLNFTNLPRIYLLSSTVDPEDYKKAKKFPQVADFISKPLSKDTLNEII